jgi:hypothetical protein
MGERGYAKEELLERSSSLDSLQELLSKVVYDKVFGSSKNPF